MDDRIPCRKRNFSFFLALIMLLAAMLPKVTRAVEMQPHFFHVPEVEPSWGSDAAAKNPGYKATGLAYNATDWNLDSSMKGKGGFPIIPGGHLTARPDWTVPEEYKPFDGRFIYCVANHTSNYRLIVGTQAFFKAKYTTEEIFPQANKGDPEFNFLMLAIACGYPKEYDAELVTDIPYSIVCQVIAWLCTNDDSPGFTGNWDSDFALFKDSSEYKSMDITFTQSASPEIHSVLHSTPTGAAASGGMTNMADAYFWDIWHVAFLTKPLVKDWDRQITSAPATLSQEDGEYHAYLDLFVNEQARMFLSGISFVPFGDWQYVGTMEDGRQHFKSASGQTDENGAIGHLEWPDGTLGSLAPKDMTKAELYTFAFYCDRVDEPGNYGMDNAQTYFSSIMDQELKLYVTIGEPKKDGGDSGVNRYEHEELFKAHYNVNLIKYDSETGKPLADSHWDILEKFDDTQLTNTDLDRAPSGGDAEGYAEGFGTYESGLGELLSTEWGDDAIEDNYSGDMGVTISDSNKYNWGNDKGSQFERWDDPEDDPCDRDDNVTGEDGKLREISSDGSSSDDIAHTDVKNYTYHKGYCTGHPAPEIEYIEAPCGHDEGGGLCGACEALNQQRHDEAWQKWYEEVKICEKLVEEGGFFHCITPGEDAMHALEDDRDQFFKDFISITYEYSAKEIKAAKGYILHGIHTDDIPLEWRTVTSSQYKDTKEATTLKYTAGGAGNEGGGDGGDTGDGGNGEGSGDSGPEGLPSYAAGMPGMDDGGQDGRAEAYTWASGAEKDGHNPEEAPEMAGAGVAGDARARDGGSQDGSSAVISDAAISDSGKGDAVGEHDPDGGRMPDGDPGEAQERAVKTATPSDAEPESAGQPDREGQAPSTAGGSHEPTGAMADEPDAADEGEEGEEGEDGEEGGNGENGDKGGSGGGTGNYLRYTITFLPSEAKRIDPPNEKIIDWTFIVYDHRTEGELHFNKRDFDLKNDASSKFDDYAVENGDGSLEGAVYGLFAAQDIIHPDTDGDGSGEGDTGMVFQKDDLVAVATTDRNGDMSFMAITEAPGSVYNYETGQIEHTDWYDEAPGNLHINREESAKTEQDIESFVGHNPDGSEIKAGDGFDLPDTEEGDNNTYHNKLSTNQEYDSGMLEKNHVTNTKVDTYRGEDDETTGHYPISDNENNNRNCWIGRPLIIGKDGSSYYIKELSRSEGYELSVYGKDDNLMTNMEAFKSGGDDFAYGTASSTAIVSDRKHGGDTFSITSRGTTDGYIVKLFNIPEGASFYMTETYYEWDDTVTHKEAKYTDTPAAAKAGSLVMVGGKSWPAKFGDKIHYKDKTFDVNNVHTVKYEDQKVEPGNTVTDREPRLDTSQITPSENPVEDINKLFLKNGFFKAENGAPWTIIKASGQTLQDFADAINDSLFTDDWFSIFNSMQMLGYFYKGSDLYIAVAYGYRYGTGNGALYNPDNGLIYVRTPVTYKNGSNADVSGFAYRTYEEGQCKDIVKGGDGFITSAVVPYEIAEGNPQYEKDDLKEALEFVKKPDETYWAYAEGEQLLDINGDPVMTSKKEVVEVSPTLVEKVTNTPIATGSYQETGDGVGTYTFAVPQDIIDALQDGNTIDFRILYDPEEALIDGILRTAQQYASDYGVISIIMPFGNADTYFELASLAYPGQEEVREDAGTIEAPTRVYERPIRQKIKITKDIQTYAKPKEVWYCLNCGYENPADSDKCGFVCGSTRTDEETVDAWWWECPDCHHKNPDRADQCENTACPYRAANGGMARPRGIGEDRIANGRVWYCRKCGHENPEGQNTCSYECGRERTAEELRDALPDGEEESLWYCLSCGHGNPESASVCEWTCGKPRGGAISYPDDDTGEMIWYCPDCGYGNPDSAQACGNTCGQPRTAEAVGVWTCSVCGQENPADRETCGGTVTADEESVSCTGTRDGSDVRQVWHCRHCGHENPDSADNCGSCGQPRTVALSRKEGHRPAEETKHIYYDNDTYAQFHSENISAERDAGWYETFRDWLARLLKGEEEEENPSGIPNFRFKAYLKSNLERLYRDDEGAVHWLDRNGNYMTPQYEDTNGDGNYDTFTWKYDSAYGGKEVDFPEKDKTAGGAEGDGAAAAAADEPGTGGSVLMSSNVQKIYTEVMHRADSRTTSDRANNLWDSYGTPQGGDQSNVGEKEGFTTSERGESGVAVQTNSALYSYNGLARDRNRTDRLNDGQEEGRNTGYTRLLETRIQYFEDGTKGKIPVETYNYEKFFDAIHAANTDIWDDDMHSTYGYNGHKENSPNGEYVSSMDNYPGQHWFETFYEKYQMDDADPGHTKKNTDKADSDGTAGGDRDTSFKPFRWIREGVFGNREGYEQHPAELNGANTEDIINTSRYARANAEASDAVRQFAEKWYLEDEAAKLMEDNGNGEDVANLSRIGHAAGTRQDKTGEVISYDEEVYDMALFEAIAKAYNYLKPFYMNDLDTIYSVEWDSAPDGGSDNDYTTLSADTPQAGGSYTAVSGYIPYGTYVIVEQEPERRDKNVNDWKNRSYETEKPKELIVPSLYGGGDSGPTTDNYENHYSFDAGMALTDQAKESNYLIRFGEEYGDGYGGAWPDNTSGQDDREFVIRAHGYYGDFEIYKYGLDVDRLQGTIDSPPNGAYSYGGWDITQEDFDPLKDYYQLDHRGKEGVEEIQKEDGGNKSSSYHGYDSPDITANGNKVPTANGSTYDGDDLRKRFFYASISEDDGTADRVVFKGGAKDQSNMSGMEWRDGVASTTGNLTAYQGRYAPMLVPWTVTEPAAGGAYDTDGFTGYADLHERNRFYSAYLKIDKTDSETGEYILHDDAIFALYAASRYNTFEEIEADANLIKDADERARFLMQFKPGDVKFYLQDTMITGSREFLEAMRARKITPYKARGTVYESMAGAGELYTGLVPKGTPVCIESERIDLADAGGSRTGQMTVWTTRGDMPMDDPEASNGRPLENGGQNVGWFKTSQPIGAGTYVLAEIKAPSGYARSKPVAIEVYFDATRYYADGDMYAKVDALRYDSNTTDEYPYLTEDMAKAGTDARTQ